MFIFKSYKTFDPYSVVTDGNEYRFVYSDGRTLSAFAYQNPEAAVEAAKHVKSSVNRLHQTADPKRWKLVEDKK